MAERRLYACTRWVPNSPSNQQRQFAPDKITLLHQSDLGPYLGISQLVTGKMAGIQGELWKLHWRIPGSSQSVVYFRDGKLEYFLNDLPTD